MKKMFIVDDEKSISNVLKFAFENDFEVFVANDMEEFDRISEANKPDIVLLDLKFGTVNGLDILARIKAAYDETIVIIMTAYGSIESSIQAIKDGAYDYILKPVKLGKLRPLIADAVKYQDMRRKIDIDMYSVDKGAEIIGDSEGVHKIFDAIDKVKDLNVSVLIQGESGTGKELVARQIHMRSNRRSFPFQIVNCAAIPENLLESEMFGYEKGAFTGADRAKKGAFEMADKGSIFLDEIGEMNLICQAKVLRAIQEHEITPLGSGQTRSIDIRIIAATNRELEAEVESGKFRKDLYYRLCVFPIYVPSLRERRDDIPHLVESFIQKANSMYGLNVKGITKGALAGLKSREYKGNIRELENIVYRACIISAGGYIDEEKVLKDTGTADNSEYRDFVPIKLGTSLENAEKQLIVKTINYVNGNKSRAAKILGISERSLYYKLRAYTEE